MRNVGIARVLVGVVAVAIAWGTTGCGDDAPTESSAATTTGASGRPCEPVGAELAAGATDRIEVELADYVINLDHAATRAGAVNFVAHNIGTEDHEVAFLPGGGPVPTVPGGEPDEAALEAAGAFELEAFGPGRTCDATFVLEPGTYTLFCVVHAPDGQTHLAHGMHATLTVT